ncbi:MAG TPA: HXXEE domain-containing protein [Pyrinomonadaceae bacterium]|nr:HXXEE domain-containing protein [Pyrinomonadaceae bacterium]
MTKPDALPSENLISLFSWLIPITYLIHIAEEFWGGEGYSAYIYRLRGVHLSPTRFLVAQAIGFALVVAAIIIARRLRFPSMMFVILTMTLMVNALTHTYNAVVLQSYNPGLVSSVLIWLPMGIFALVRFYRATTQKRYWLAIAIGIGINVVVGVITMRGGRLT